MDARANQNIELHSFFAHLPKGIFKTSDGAADGEMWGKNATCMTGVPKVFYILESFQNSLTRAKKVTTSF